MACGGSEYRSIDELAEVMDEEKEQVNITLKNFRRFVEDLLKIRQFHTKRAQVNEIRLVIVGKIGSGKRAIANTLLKLNSLEPITKESVDVSKRIRFKIKIVDTQKTDNFLEQCEEEERIKEAVQSLLPGPHAFLLVNRDGGSTDDKVATAYRIEFLGERVLQYAVFVTFNGGFGNENRKNAKECRFSSRSSIVMKICYDRHFSFNNMACGSDKEKQIDELLSLIYKMKQTNNPSHFILREGGLSFNRSYKTVKKYIHTFMRDTPLVELLSVIYLMYIIFRSQNQIKYAFKRMNAIWQQTLDVGTNIENKSAISLNSVWQQMMFAFESMN